MDESNMDNARAAETESQRRLEQLSLLLDVGKSIVSHLNLRELIGVISDYLRQVIHCDGVWMALYDPESEQLCVYALDPKFRQDATTNEGNWIPMEGTGAEQAIRSLQTIMVTRAMLENSPSPVMQNIAALGVKSGCIAPLISRGRAIGALSMVSMRENAFTKEDAELFTQIAGQIAIAVDNAHNFERAREAEQELSRKLNHLRLMLKINNAVVSQLDLAELIQVISSSLSEVIGNDTTGVLLFDPEIGQLRAFMTNFPPGHPLAEKGFPVPIEGGPSGLAFTSGQPVFVDKPDFDKFHSDLSRRVFEEGYRSGVTIPLIAQGRKLGVLGVTSKREQAFSDEDKELLSQVANQIAIAVDNALNYKRARAAEEEAKSEAARRQLLLDVSNSVTAHLDLRELFKAISACLRQAISYDGAGLSIYDDESKQLRVYALETQVTGETPFKEGMLIPIENSQAETVFASRQTTIFGQEDLRKIPSPIVRRLVADGVQASCMAPLISHGQVYGVLAALSLRENAFTGEDAELLTQIAAQVAIAVENALNFEKARAAERQAAEERDRSRLLLNINNAVISHLDLSELVKKVSASLRDIIPHDAAGIALYDPELNQLREYTNVAYKDVEAFREGDAIPLKGTPAGQVFLTGQPLLIRRPDPAKYPADRYSQNPVEGSPKSACLVPLISHGQKLGVAGISCTEVERFTDEDLTLFNQIAGQIAIALDNALAYREIESLKNKLTEEKLYLEEEIRTAYSFEEIIGSSPALTRILKQVATVAPTDSTVLIRGETGTGKELIARAIHNLSARCERTLVKLNCAAIPTGLLESELFGHERGAFTGAIAQRIGRFELANKGTLFLDEVGDIPLELQPKLLRVLQEQEFERLGSVRTQRVDVRVVTATNSNLEQMVADKQFRGDLFYRLNVFPITLPPLRERREDIPLLIRFFAQKFAGRMRKRIETIPAQALETLTGYHWPGNIRELENFIERAVILSSGAELEVPLTELKPAAAATAGNTAPISTLQDAEREHILRALEETDWVVSGPNGAAARLGMKRTTLQARMQKLGISRQC